MPRSENILKTAGRGKKLNLKITLYIPESKPPCTKHLAKDSHGCKWPSNEI